MKATEIILRDHRAAEELFERYKKANEEGRDALEPKLFAALDAHEKMEDDYFYPALREASGDDQIFDELEVEQAALKASVLALKAMPVDRSDAVKAAMEKVLAHARKEETEVLPRAEELLSSTELEELGAKMEPESAVVVSEKE